MNKLPVISSVSEVLSGVIRHYFQLIMVAWPAILLLILAFGGITWIYMGSGILDLSIGKHDPEKVKAALARLESPGAITAFIVGALAAIVASAVAAVRWHRFVLLGEGADGQLSNIRMLRGEDGSYIWTSIRVGLSYALVILAFGVLFMVISMVGRTLTGGASNGILSVIFVLAGIVLYLTALMVMFRLMIALPDAALGRGGRLFEMFEKTKGNSWRLFGAFLILLLIAGTATVIGSLVVGLFGALGIAGTLIGGILYIGIYLFSLMVQITMLSVAYREIVGMPGEQESPAAI